MPFAHATDARIHIHAHTHTQHCGNYTKGLLHKSASLFRHNVIQITCTQPPSCSISPCLLEVEVGCESIFAPSDSAIMSGPTLKPTVGFFFFFFYPSTLQWAPLCRAGGDGFIFKQASFAPETPDTRIT